MSGGLMGKLQRIYRGMLKDSDSLSRVLTFSDVEWLPIALNTVLPGASHQLRQHVLDALGPQLCATAIERHPAGRFLVAIGLDLGASGGCAG